MKRNYWNLFWAILAASICIGHTFLGNDTKNVFGFEISSWFYRGFWFLVTIKNLINFLNPKQEEKKPENIEM